MKGKKQCFQGGLLSPPPLTAQLGLDLVMQGGSSVLQRWRGKSWLWAQHWGSPTFFFQIFQDWWPSSWWPVQCFCVSAAAWHWPFQSHWLSPHSHGNREMGFRDSWEFQGQLCHRASFLISDLSSYIYITSGLFSLRNSNDDPGISLALLWMLLCCARFR